MEGLGDQPLADLGTVRVRGVDQIDPELHGAPQHGDRFRLIARLPPNPPAGEPHGPETEAVYGKVAAHEKRAAPRRWDHR